MKVKVFKFDTTDSEHIEGTIQEFLKTLGNSQVISVAQSQSVVSTAYLNFTTIVVTIIYVEEPVIHQKLTLKDYGHD